MRCSREVEGGEEREPNLVRADERIPFAAAEEGPLEDVFLRAIVADLIEVRGDEPAGCVAQIPDGRERLQEDLGENDRGAEVENDPALEVAQGGRENPEIAVRREAGRGAVEGGMLVDRIGADRDVRR